MNIMIIYILTTVFMFNSGNHYLFYPDGFILTVSTMAMEIFRLLVYFSIFNYFTDQVVRRLKNSENWRCGLKILLAINIAWCQCSLIVNLIAY